MTFVLFLQCASQTSHVTMNKPACCYRVWECAVSFSMWHITRCQYFWKKKQNPTAVISIERLLKYSDSTPVTNKNFKHLSALCTPILICLNNLCRNTKQLSGCAALVTSQEIVYELFLTTPGRSACATAPELCSWTTRGGAETQNTCEITHFWCLQEFWLVKGLTEASKTHLNRFHSMPLKYKFVLHSSFFTRSL